MNEGRDFVFCIAFAYEFQMFKKLTARIKTAQDDSLLLYAEMNS